MNRSDINKNTVLGVEINTSTIDDIISRSMASIAKRNEQLHISCANPHSLVTAQYDSDFMSALRDSEIVVADGTGIVILAKILGQQAFPRITGHDCFEGILSQLNKQGEGRVFFFGSSENVLSLIKDKFGNAYPSLTFAGSYSPPYGNWDDIKNEDMINTINNTRPDVIWVGMTAPKQEKWVYNNRHKLDAKIIGSIGAVFDFFAGTHPRAPKWMTRCGLEWLYRLYREPKRMWRRNFISTPKFLYLGIRERVSKKMVR